MLRAVAFRHRRTRWMGLVTATAMVFALGGGAVAAATPDAVLPVHAAADGPPANPDWQKYVLGPSSTDVRPVSVVSTAGVVGEDALIHPGAGKVATLTATTPQTLTSSPVAVTVPTTPARYVRLDVTELGLAAAGDPAGQYVQLAELQVFGADPGKNLASGRPVTASETIEAAGWSTQYLTDGVDDTNNPAAHGWTSNAHPAADVSSAPVWVTIDLGSVQSISSVVLWPRSDTLSPDRQTASFPVDYAVQTSATDDQTTSFSTQQQVAGQTNPPVPTLTGGASIILDYGTEVGGYPTFDVTAVTGSPILQAGYSETRTQLSPTGDGVSPWASGDPKRYDSYTVTKPGPITNSEIQGGERYQQVSLTTPGTISLSGVGIKYTPYLATADKYQGYFVSSSDELNRAWYSGAYTAAVNQMPAGSIGPRWNTDQGSLDVPGQTGGAGLLKVGKAWTDYTVTFQTSITANQAGWVVRGSDAQSGYLMILDASDDTSPGGPNVLQMVSAVNGNYQTIANVPLSSPIDPGTWHSIKEVVAGTTVTTSIDGVQVAVFDSATFASGVGAHAVGSFGFRQFTGEQAGYRDLTVTAPDGSTLYDNALSTPTALTDFNIPGTNAVPLIVDGAKRDRAVWSGDLAVEGPTLFYSTNTPEYIRGSLELLGSWAGSNGYVSGSMPPQTPINTGPLGETRSGYSASYSMYFVRGLAEYYQYTADAAFVQQEWTLVQNELAWSATQVDGNGLFATNAGTGADWDYYDGPKTGEVTAYNALYHQTLLDGADLAVAAGHPELADQYITRAAALKTAMNANLFNATTGVYDLSDGTRGVIAQDANVAAINYGIAPVDKVAGILAKIKSSLWTPSGTLPYSSGYQNTISPFISGFELNARLGADDTDNALQLLTNEWGPMLAPGDLYTGTFWENESTSGTQASDQTSMAHGWSTMPTAALSKYVLGIQPVESGYRTWLVQPHTGTLAWTQGQAPTPHGPVVVKPNRDQAAQPVSMQVVAPVGTSGTIAVPTFGQTIDIKVNGQRVWSGSAAVRGGTHVGSATKDGDYIDLAVPAGSYDISTSITPKPKPQHIIFAQPANRIVGDRDFRVSAAASSRLPVFFSARGVCTISGSRIHLTGHPGTCTVRATQPGNADYLPAPAISRLFSVAADHQPVARPDAASTRVDRAVSIAVLANDTDADRDRLSISRAGRAAHGTAWIAAGKVRYTPKRGYLGRDAFTYSIQDGRGGTATATVTVTVKNR